MARPEDNEYVNSAGIKLEDFKKAINASGIYNRSETDWFNKFNRYGFIDPYSSVSHTTEYLFFTKPDLHLYKGDSTSGINPEIAHYPFFNEMKKNYNRVLQQLQSSAGTGKFINVLSNSVKNTLDIPTLTAKISETSSTIYGTKLSYRMGSSGDEELDFSLEFEDTKYLDLYMLFKCWDEYNQKKALGLVSPKDDYVINKILHDQIAIYKIVVGEDGKTIIYYAKLYGCYPTSVPREAFSDMNSSGGLRYSVPWKAFAIEDMDPLILRDFNKLISSTVKGTKHDLPLFDRSNGCSNTTWATSPYVYERLNMANFDPRQYKYELRWR